MIVFPGHPAGGNPLYLVTVEEDGSIYGWVRREKGIFRKRSYYTKVDKKFKSVKKAWKWLIAYDCGYH